LTSALDGSELLTSRPGRFTPGERAPGAPWIGGWVYVIKKMFCVSVKIDVTLREEHKLRGIENISEEDILVEKERTNSWVRKRHYK
jgi:hypothetical protein